MSAFKHHSASFGYPFREMHSDLPNGSSWDTVAKLCIGIIEILYESPEVADNILAFHNADHTYSVVRRTKQIMTRIGEDSKVSDTEIATGILAAYSHDLIQCWHEGIQWKNGNPRIIRIKQDDNEERSAQWANNIASSLGHDFETIINSDLLYESILATKVRLNKEYKTLVQPELSTGASVTARAVAISDLDRIISGPASYENDCYKVFQEDNLDFSRYCRSGGRDNLVEEDFRIRMCEWYVQQKDFVLGRLPFLIESLSYFPARARALFEHLAIGNSSRFADCMDRRLLTIDTKSSSFTDIAVAFGYKLEHI